MDSNMCKTLSTSCTYLEKSVLVPSTTINSYIPFNQLIPPSQILPHTQAQALITIIILIELGRSVVVLNVIIIPLVLVISADIKRCTRIQE